MATAKMTIIEKVITTKVTEPGYTLELTPDEFDTLYIILMKIGGHPDTTRRKYSASVLNALISADKAVERRHKYNTLEHWFTKTDGADQTFRRSHMYFER